MHSALFGIPLILALQISIVFSRPTTSSVLSSLSFELANITHAFFSTNRENSNLTLEDGRRVDDLYGIPSSDIVLRISRDPNTALPPDKAIRSLKDVSLTAYVKQLLPGSVPPRIFRHQEPQGGVNFSITNSYAASEFSWRDVLVISHGLIEYYEGNQLWQESLFYARSQSRGLLGAGLLSNSD